MIDYDPVVKFAQDRHRVWEGLPARSPIIATRKFTNVFRVLDRGSQYLLRLMDAYEDVQHRLALSYLYRQVNRPDTMEAIIQRNGDYIPTFEEITDEDWIREVIWPVIEKRPGEFLNGAYMILIMTNDPRSLGEKMADIFPGARENLLRVADTTDLATRVRLLHKTRGLGPFLSMQIATDLGYCRGEPDQENTFILPGPGSRKGVACLLGKERVSEREAREVITSFPVERLPYLPYSNGRRASWMDVQNVFCEYSKYVRYTKKGQWGGEPYAKGKPFRVRIPKQFMKEK